MSLLVNPPQRQGQNLGRGNLVFWAEPHSWQLFLTINLWEASPAFCRATVEQGKPEYRQQKITRGICFAGLREKTYHIVADLKIWQIVAPVDKKSVRGSFVYLPQC
jgi:hypothetical protein